MRATLWVAMFALTSMIVIAPRYAVRGGRHLGTPTQRAAYETLHTANLATPALRAGLTPGSAARCSSSLRALLGTRGLVLADANGLLVADGVDPEHCDLLDRHLRAVLSSGRPTRVASPQLDCHRGGTCVLQEAVVVPVQVDGRVVAALAAVDAAAPAGLLRLSGEVARFVSTQLELAELDGSREREIRIEDAESDALVTVDDVGVGADPTRLRRILAGTADDESVGLRNVDERLRAVFGEEYGLVIETALEAGTRVTFRIPKSRIAAKAS